MSDTETARNLDFKRYPGLSDYVACALQDLQLSESDESCTDDREERDSGTIYTLTQVTYDAMRDHWVRFATDCAAHIEVATDYNPGNNPHAAQAVTIERIGSTYWLAQCGSGVTFTDDGDAPCLQAMADYASAHSLPSLYFGDNGKVYLS